MSVFITIELDGETKRLGITPTSEEARSIASRAELVLQGLGRKYATIAADETLSSEGIRQARESAAASYLSGFDPILKDLDEARHKLEADQNRVAAEALAPRRESDIAGTLVDLKVADRIHALDDKAQLIRHAETGALDADAQRVAATLPAITTGLTPQQRSSVRNSVVRQHDPVAAAAFDDRAQQIDLADTVLQSAYRATAESGVNDFGKRSEAAPQAYQRYDAHPAMMASLPMNPAA